ncbi:N-6 DNA methylase [Candidatus Halobeggiatoa sp. HSG11]|nr:N-6 DNA methylase [Candidatus Halobeggiatoa sp. HSG11]
MQKLQIQNYYKKLENLIQYGGSRNEESIRRAFENLLDGYCGPKNFTLVAEITQAGESGKIRPDGVVKDALRLDWGYWEAKDSKDDLDKEIKKKLAKGYPNDNIIFEDSQTAVLIQTGVEVLRIDMQEPEQLDKILTRFLNYERPEVRDFRQAIEQFKDDLPTVVETLRATLEQQKKKNSKFKQAFKGLFDSCQESINSNINDFDIGEMIIQHILTEEIFLTVFNERQFHQENVIAQQLQNVVNSFFVGKMRRDTLLSIESYYLVIRRRADNISNHHEKQKFLKVIYENFYKSYNPKAADRLGVVYTPNEIVRFMIESTDFLLEKHFNRLLADKNVDILDPCTGTGTFVTELIDYLPKRNLTYKYLNEIHCNEVAILPYYIANLNIEYTFQQKMGEYEPFSHICFVDTLDNLGFEHGYENQQVSLNIGLNEGNIARIKEQNERKISVIIGNPPYNANQQNENDNNKNREYPEIDEAIKRTYIANSTAQKTKMYDMYTRFIRWASSRIDKNGVIAFVSNSSFLEASSYDGFRKVVAEEFNTIYAIDLKGNARTSGERRRKESGNVFSDEIRVGIAIYFLIKDENSKGCKIYYNAIRDYAKSEEKKEYLRDNTLNSLDFERITPDKNHNWLNIADNDFDDLLSLANKGTKLAKSQKEEKAIFKLFSNGFVTGRDEWVYDFNAKNLISKMEYFYEEYNHEVKRWIEFKKETNYFDKSSDSNPDVNDFLSERNLIKWSKMIKRDKLRKEKTGKFNKRDILKVFYRPYSLKYVCYGYIPIDVRGQLDEIFPSQDKQNKAIVFNCNCSTFATIATDILIEYGSLLVGGGRTQCVSLYRYDSEGNRIDNITDWGLNQFQNHYQDQTITKQDIFHYTYAVLHNPAYRQKYQLNLKREFPRLPYYDNFQQWVAWGQKLMDSHINYEAAKKYQLKRIDIDSNKANKPKLKADKEAGKIYLDQQTTLQGIPEIAWTYKLGNRSALEWILDQYKEKKPRDKTIAEKFNNYKFADYKEQVIELLQRVCTVSVETMEIVGEMGE